MAGCLCTVPTGMRCIQQRVEGRMEGGNIDSRGSTARIQLGIQGWNPSATSWDSPWNPTRRLLPSRRQDIRSSSPPTRSQGKIHRKIPVEGPCAPCRLCSHRCAQPSHQRCNRYRGQTSVKDQTPKRFSFSHTHSHWIILPSHVKRAVEHHSHDDRIQRDHSGSSHPQSDRKHGWIVSD